MRPLGRRLEDDRDGWRHGSAAFAVSEEVLGPDREDRPTGDDGVEGGGARPVRRPVDQSDGVGEDIGQLVELGRFVFEDDRGRLSSVPEVLPTSPPGVDDAGEESVEIAQEIWIDPAWVGCDDVGMVAHGDGAMENEPVLLSGPPEAVLECAVGLAIWAQQEPSLRAAPRERVCLVLKHGPRLHAECIDLDREALPKKYPRSGSRWTDERKCISNHLPAAGTRQWRAL